MECANQNYPSLAVKPRFSAHATRHDAAVASAQLLRFLTTLDEAIRLSSEQQSAIRADFLQGISVLVKRGATLSEALRRLAPNRLGGFYEKEACVFYPLDNGAKQYPLIMKRGQMAMFRVTAILREPVVPELLQLALTFVIRRFPHFATRMRRGAFWYYLKPCLARYAVTPQTDNLCQPIDLSDDRQQLFRVMYGSTAVTVEIFHILTDGMGGTIFLQSLLAEYYRLLGEEAAPVEGQVIDTVAVAQSGDTENGFWRFHSRDRGDNIIGAPAIQIPAVRLPQGEVYADQFRFNATDLHRVAAEHTVSVTALMAAIILLACSHTARAKSGSYRIQIPINLRKLFDCNTLRNFAWFCTLSADAAKPYTPEALLSELAGQLRQYTDKEALLRNVSVGTTHHPMVTIGSVTMENPIHEDRL